MVGLNRRAQGQSQFAKTGIFGGFFLFVFFMDFFFLFGSWYPKTKQNPKKTKNKTVKTLAEHKLRKQTSETTQE